MPFLEAFQVCMIKFQACPADVPHGCLSLGISTLSTLSQIFNPPSPIQITTHSDASRSQVTFFFTFFFYGWASLQALLEADGVLLSSF